MAENVGLRVGSAFLLFALTISVGILPSVIFKFLKKRKQTTIFKVSTKRSKKFWTTNNTVRILMFFGGGVLLATCFIHLIPEVRENFDTYFEHQKNNGSEGGHSHGHGHGHDHGHSHSHEHSEKPSELDTAESDPDEVSGLHHDHDHDHEGHDHSAVNPTTLPSRTTGSGHNHGRNHDHDHNGAENHNHTHDEDEEGASSGGNSGHSHSGKDSHGGHGHSHSHKVPYVELAVCGGFFVIYLLEELVHTFIGHDHEGHGSEADDRSTIGTSADSNGLVTPPTDVKFPRNLTLDINPKALDADGYINYAIDLKNEDMGPSCPRIVVNELDVGVHQPVYHTASCDELVTTGNNSPQPITRVAMTGSDPNSPINTPMSVRFVQGLVVIIAFSAHSIFDGVAIGLQEESTRIWTMFFAICSHKLVVAFAVGMELMDKTASLLITTIHMSLFAFMSPLGIFIVLATESKISESDSPVIILLSAVATGTILYIVFFEILQRDRSKDASKLTGLILYLSMIIGFTFMFCLTLYVVH